MSNFLAGQRLTASALNTALAGVSQLISQQILTGSVSSVTFSSIPQTFTNLRLILAARSDGAGANGYDNAVVQFNGVTTGYSWSTIWVTQGGAVQTTGGTTQSAIQCAEVWNSHFATTGRGIATIDIPNYSSGSGLKSLQSQTAASDAGAAGIQQIYSGCSNITAAITSITVAMSTGNFIAPSMFSLYGS